MLVLNPDYPDGCSEPLVVARVERSVRLLEQPGVMGACTLTYMLSGAILQRALAELILIEGVKPL